MADGLTDLRCQAYDPLEAARAPERPIARSADCARLNTNAMWSRAEMEARVGPGGAKRPRLAEGAGAGDGGAAEDSAARLAASQYCWLRDLMAADEGEFDYNILTKPADDGGKSTAPKPRRRSSVGGASTGGRSSGRARGRASGGGRAGARGRGRGKKKAGHSSSEDEESDYDDDDDDDYQ